MSWHYASIDTHTGPCELFSFYMCHLTQPLAGVPNSSSQYQDCPPQALIRVILGRSGFGAPQGTSTVPASANFHAEQLKSQKVPNRFSILCPSIMMKYHIFVCVFTSFSHWVLGRSVFSPHLAIGCLGVPQQKSRVLSGAHSCLPPSILFAITFVCQVLEHCGASKIFKPPNPWMMGILMLLVEIRGLPDLKWTLMFEVEVLLQRLSIDMGDITQQIAKNPDKTNMQRLEQIRKTIDIHNSTDFMSKEPHAPHAKPKAEDGPYPAGPPARGFPGPFGGAFGPPPGMGPDGPVTSMQPPGIPQGMGMGTPGPGMGGPPGMEGQGMPLGSGAAGAAGLTSAFQAVPGGLPDTGQPQESRMGWAPLEEVLLNHQYLQAAVQLLVPLPPLLKGKPDLKLLVATAIDFAVKEIIEPVVERSVMIACTTTRELVVKDFSTDPDDTKMWQVCSSSPVCSCGRAGEQAVLIRHYFLRGWVQVGPARDRLVKGDFPQVQNSKEFLRGAVKESCKCGGGGGEGLGAPLIGGGWKGVPRANGLFPQLVWNLNGNWSWN